MVRGAITTAIALMPLPPVIGTTDPATIVSTATRLSQAGLITAITRSTPAGISVPGTRTLPVTVRLSRDFKVVIFPMVAATVYSAAATRRCGAAIRLTGELTLQTGAPTMVLPGRTTPVITEAITDSAAVSGLIARPCMAALRFSRAITWATTATAIIASGKS